MEEGKTQNLKVKLVGGRVKSLAPKPRRWTEKRRHEPGGLRIELRTKQGVPCRAITAVKQKMCVLVAERGCTHEEHNSATEGVESKHKHNGRQVKGARGENECHCKIRTTQTNEYRSKIRVGGTTIAGGPWGELIQQLREKEKSRAKHASTIHLRKKKKTTRGQRNKW